MIDKILTHLRMPLQPESLRDGTVAYDVTGEPILRGEWDEGIERGPPPSWDGVAPPAPDGHPEPLELPIACTPYSCSGPESPDSGTAVQSWQNFAHVQQDALVFDAFWTFVRVAGVEPTNNESERTLRHAVIYRHICLGTQSEAGSRFVERILTVEASLRRQQRDMLQFLTDACQAALLNSAPPSLIPTQHTATSMLAAA